MLTIGLFLQKLTSSLVGKDEYGNSYYERRAKDSRTGRYRRFVIYNGAKDPTHLPLSWYGWLHHIHDVVEPYERERLFNTTGTHYAQKYQKDIKASFYKKEQKYESFQ